MKTKEEILDNKFEERGIRKGWIDESKQAVLDAMDEYADEKLRLYHVSTRLSFEEIGELADKWLEDEIAKDPQDQFTDREKYWMLEGFIEGYKKAQNGC